MNRKTLNHHSVKSESTSPGESESTPLGESNDSRRENTSNDVRAPSLTPLLVRASAGTGKTYQLTGRLMKILFGGAPVETILATTFTRKAAGEILDRVLINLARAADPNDDKTLQMLREQVGIPTLSRTACLQQLRRVLQNIHRLRICTLDSLFSQLARSFPFELGLPPAWRLTDEIEEVWMREAAADSMISALDPGEMVSLLAMLGKGESRRSIAREVLRVVEQGYTLQRQCDDDVWEKVRAPKSPEPSELTRVAGELRSISLPQKSLVKKLNATADLLDSRDLKALVADTLLINIARARRTNDIVKYGSAKFPESVLDDAFDKLYAAVRTKALSLLSEQNRATGHILAAYDSHVTSLKHAARTLGFDDVAARLANQFAKFDADALHNRMDGAIDHLLLDEFQDTSAIQWQVLRPLARRSAAPAPDVDDALSTTQARSFFCVGDTKQAIYGWRGGVAEIFDAVETQIQGVESGGLHESFRSSPVILDVVNRVFLNLTRHPIAVVKDSKDLADASVFEAEALSRFASNFKEHISRREDLDGHVSFRTSRSSDGDSATKKLCVYEDAAALIDDLHAKAPHVSIGVLTRSNAGVAQMYFQLDQLGIDVSQEGGNPLTDSAAVEIVLSALMWAEHPGDLRWRFHVLSTPLVDRLPGSKLESASGANFIRQMVEDRGLTETIEYLADGLAGNCDARDTIRLRQLTHLAMQYQQNTAPRIRDFVRMVRQKRVERPQQAPVRVMTIHQSKGLEFDAVVLPELSGDLASIRDAYVADVPNLGDPPVGISRWMEGRSRHFLSTHWQREFGKKIRSVNTEALCTLYVAMTRARQALYMFSQPANKTDFATKTPASLIYHALNCSVDPTESETTLFEMGNRDWFASTGKTDTTGERLAETAKSTEIRFQPLPPVPRRNRVKK
tara:strand:+ start:75185 stop:77920 length:2736 start_codon:yes stop_codon:yes gene_type:complete